MNKNQRRSTIGAFDYPLPFPMTFRQELAWTFAVALSAIACTGIIQFVAVAVALPAALHLAALISGVLVGTWLGANYIGPNLALVLEPDEPVDD